MGRLPDPGGHRLDRRSGERSVAGMRAGSPEARDRPPRTVDSDRLNAPPNRGPAGGSRARAPRAQAAGWESRIPRISPAVHPTPRRLPRTRRSYEGRQRHFPRGLWLVACRASGICLEIGQQSNLFEQIVGEALGLVRDQRRQPPRCCMCLQHVLELAQQRGLGSASAGAQVEPLWRGNSLRTDKSPLLSERA